MSQLEQIIAYLAREEVEEAILESGAPVRFRIGGSERPTGARPATAAQIASVFAGTPVEALIARGARGGDEIVRLLGSSYRAVVSAGGAGPVVRLSRARAPIPTASVAPPMASPAPATEPTPRAVPQRPVVTGSELAQILIAARSQGASDVHVIAERRTMVRRYGELVAAGDPLPAARVEAMLTALCDAEQLERLKVASYVDLGADVTGAGRVRANLSHHAGGLKGSFRLIRDTVPSLPDLGLPEELHKVTSYHQGLAVIAGPSGHGKTTTLAALVDGINASHPFHIVTIEDPVEFVHPGKRALVSQREVGTHTKSYATALKAALREDPDVIVIGELRDRETVEIALTAAETGHLVLATMSTPSAAKTIDRLIELFPPEDQPQVRATLAGTLKFVLAQRLLRTTHGDRVVAAAELVTGNTAVWTLIRENKLFQLPNLLQRGKAFGMVRFDDSLADLVRAGVVDLESAKAVAQAPQHLAALVAGGAAPVVDEPSPEPAPARGRLGNLLRRP